MRRREVQYFRCWRVEHIKWKCSNIEIEREKRSEEEKWKKV